MQNNFPTTINSNRFSTRGFSYLSNSWATNSFSHQPPLIFNLICVTWPSFFSSTAIIINTRLSHLLSGKCSIYVSLMLVSNSNATAGTQIRPVCCKSLSWTRKEFLEMMMRAYPDNTKTAWSSRRGYSSWLPLLCRITFTAAISHPGRKINVVGNKRCQN